MENGLKRRSTAKQQKLKIQEGKRIKENFKRLNIKMTIDMKKQIKEIVQNHFIFYQITDEHFQTIVKNLFFTFTKKDQVIFKEKEPIQNFFIIQEGTVLIKVNGEVVAKKSKGAFFGDLGVVYNSERTATVQCETDLYCWALKKEVLVKILNELKEADFQQNFDYIREVSFFKELTNDQLEKIVRGMVREKYKQGQIIVRQGDQSNSFYLIKEGSVSVIRDNKIILSLGEGKHFGESAFDDKVQKRLATIVALNDCQCFSIQRDILKIVFNANMREIAQKNRIRRQFLSNIILNKFLQDQIDQIISSLTFQTH